MTETFNSNEIAEINEVYGTTQSLDEGSEKLLRIDAVPLPDGCNPKTTQVLLKENNGADRPEIYVKGMITLPNGVTPRSTSTVAIEGESWMQFSYQFEWNAQQQSLVQFISTALMRFALDE